MTTSCYYANIYRLSISIGFNEEIVALFFFFCEICILKVSRNYAFSV